MERGADCLLLEIKNEQQVVINLSPEEIFHYMSNLENMVDWTSVVISVRKLSSGKLAAGAMVKTTIRFLGRWMDLVFELIECEANRCMTFKSISGPVPCLFCYRFMSDGSGRTILSQEALIQHVDGIVDLTETVIASAVRRQIEFDLQTLKDILEARTCMVV
jgi:uncharacterized membrane protein